MPPSVSMMANWMDTQPSRVSAREAWPSCHEEEHPIHWWSFALFGSGMVVTRAGVADEKLAPYGQRITILIRMRGNRIRRHRSWRRAPLSYPRTFAMVRREPLDVHWAGASKLKFTPKPTNGGGGSEAGLSKAGGSSRTPPVSRPSGFGNLAEELCRRFTKTRPHLEPAPR